MAIGSGTCAIIDLNYIAMKLESKTEYFKHLNGCHREKWFLKCLVPVDATIVKDLGCCTPAQRT